MTQTRHPIVYYIDAVLLTILIITVIYAQIIGKYVNKEVITVETCYGEPTSNGIQTLKELGYGVQKTPTEEDTKWTLPTINQTTQQQQSK